VGGVRVSLSKERWRSAMKRAGLVVVGFLLLLIGAAMALVYPLLVKPKSVPANRAGATATYVGAEKCKECHTKEYQDWTGSHHQLAMQVATPATVLGDFRNATFTYYGVTSRFFMKDERFYVNTDGPDGKLQDYEIKYTFGVYPLQQYLIPFSDGRMQALSIVWDSRPKQQGGQRWFHLYPKERIRAGDELHWTNLQQNWNFMCSECHSTDVRKNYDQSTNSYKTTWSEINVGCEDCHGAASEHVKRAQAKRNNWGGAVSDDGLLARFDDRRNASWEMNPSTGNSVRSRPRANADEVEMCGRCHARRSELSENWAPGHSLLDTHRVALLDRGLYTADGQMQDEVYNYGSFLQSRMFHEGVTCSDCHDPHTQKLRREKQEVCGICHDLRKYASTEHHHHKQETAEANCIACHMSVRTYMVVDPRHDHSFRIPRPDESVKYGTPNACNDCHRDKTPAWAAKATEQWYGSQHPGYQRYTGTLTEARQQSEKAAADLLTLANDSDAPNIARATALTELVPYLDVETYNAARASLESDDPLLRLAAVDLLSTTDPATRWHLLAPVLEDRVLAVRSAAANGVADAVPKDPTPNERDAFQRAVADFIATQRFNADRPEAHLSLGNLYARQGHMAEAEREYTLAIQLWPGFIPAYVNLADLYRASQRDDEAERWLLEARKQAPENADVTHSLALLRVRQHRMAESLDLLARAAQLAPDNAHYAYVYGIGLYSTGKTALSLEVLRKANERFPGNREILLGLTSIAGESGDLAEASRYAKKFQQVAPSDPRVAQFMRQLQGNFQ
jgi:Flp pilus assembly protein TadD